MPAQPTNSADTVGEGAVLSYRPLLDTAGWRPPFARLIASGWSHRWLVIRLSISAGLITLLLATTDIGRILEILAGAQPLPLLAAAGLFSVGTVLSACRWRLVLGARDPNPPGVHFLTGVLLIGMFFNLFLPSTVGGDVVRAELTKSRARGRIGAYSSVLFDRFIAFVSILVISFSAALLAHLRLGWFEPYVVAVWLVFLLGGAAFVVTVLWFPTQRAPDWARRGAPGRLCEWLEQAQSTLRSYITDFSLVGRVLLLAVVVQATALILTVWLLAGALRVDASLVLHLIAVPIIELVALVPVSFNGMGLREGAYVLFYAGAGVAPEAAIALSFSYTILLLAFGLIGGICWSWPMLYDGGGIGSRRRHPR